MTLESIISSHNVERVVDKQCTIFRFKAYTDSAPGEDSGSQLATYIEPFNGLYDLVKHKDRIVVIKPLVSLRVPVDVNDTDVIIGRIQTSVCFTDLKHAMVMKREYKKAFRTFPISDFQWLSENEMPVFGYRSYFKDASPEDRRDMQYRCFLYRLAIKALKSKERV